MFAKFAEKGCLRAILSHLVAKVSNKIAKTKGKQVYHLQDATSRFSELVFGKGEACHRALA